MVDGAVEQLQEDLKWLGIEFDEGPGNNERYGPYIQSKRLENYKYEYIGKRFFLFKYFYINDIYRKRTEQLLNSGYAYKCYCTEKRLDLLRRDALRTRTVPRYDNKCRSLDKEELKNNEGKIYCIRFKVYFLFI